MLNTTLLRAALLDPGPARHALRTALAASITYALTQFLRLDQGYWAVFSSILVMQANVGSSLAASWARLLGTAAGAALGALVASLFGPGLWATTAAMFLGILLCSRLAANNETLRLASLTAALVLCLHAPGSNPFWLGLTRFLEVALGIVVALAISFAWPSRARVVLRHGLSKGLEHLAGLTAALMDSRMQGSYDRQRIFHHKDAVLRLSLRNRQLLQAARREPGSSGQRGKLQALLELEERMAEHLLTMDHAIENAPAEGFHLHLSAELAEMGAAVQATMLELAQALPAPQAPPPDILARLDSALDTAADKLLALRPTRVIAGYDLDEVMHFYSFYHALRETAREVRKLAERLAQK